MALSCGVTLLLLRIAFARFRETGAWNAPLSANFFLLGAVGAAGILCGLLLYVRPGVLPVTACVAWAAAVVALSFVLAGRGDESASLIALLGAGAGALALPWGSSPGGQAGRPWRR